MEGVKNTPKPTRFVTDLIGFEGPMHSGTPQFDKVWKYLGPLPSQCPHPGRHEQLIGQDEEGKWKTAPAAHYPGPLCLFLAKAIVNTWRQSSIPSLGSSLTAKTREDQPEFSVEDNSLQQALEALDMGADKEEEVKQVEKYRLRLFGSILACNLCGAE